MDPNNERNLEHALVDGAHFPVPLAYPTLLASATDVVSEASALSCVQC